MPSPDLPAVEAAIVELTNAFRAEERLGAVRPNAQLTAVARAFAGYLARTDKFAHEADGRKPAERVKAGGYGYCLTSENLALNYDTRGFATRQLARDAVEGWKNSPGHRRNMVEPNVVDIGVGVAKAPGKEQYLSVQLFGRPASMQYQFKVANRSGVTVRYRSGERPVDIKADVQITHTECLPVRVTFDVEARAPPPKASARTPVADTGPPSFLPGPGSSYLIERARDGRLTVREAAGR